MTEKGERCRQHYQSVYERNQPEPGKGRALDECLHHFLDQRPAGKNLSAIDRAIGLASVAGVRSDVSKALQIGQLWEQITRGQGYCHSCNHDKESYGDDLGIGVIQREDLDIRPKVHYAMRYLGKDTQHLRLKPEGARCLRKGQVKKVSWVANPPTARQELDAE